MIDENKILEINEKFLNLDDGEVAEEGSDEFGGAGSELSEEDAELLGTKDLDLHSQHQTFQ